MVQIHDEHGGVCMAFKLGCADPGDLSASHDMALNIIVLRLGVPEGIYFPSGLLLGGLSALLPTTPRWPSGWATGPGLRPESGDLDGPGGGGAGGRGHLQAHLCRGALTMPASDLLALLLWHCRVPLCRHRLALPVCQHL